MNGIKMWVVNLVVPMLLGPLVFALVQLLKQVSGWVDARPAWQKRVLVPALAILLTTASGLAGGSVQCDANGALADCLTQFSPEVLKGMVGAGVAFLLHFLKTRPVVVA